jgi:hypothetical protein
LEGAVLMCAIHYHCTTRSTRSGSRWRLIVSYGTQQRNKHWSSRQMPDNSWLCRKTRTNHRHHERFSSDSVFGQVLQRRTGCVSTYSPPHNFRRPRTTSWDYHSCWTTWWALYLHWSRVLFLIYYELTFLLMKKSNSNFFPQLDFSKSLKLFDFKWLNYVSFWVTCSFELWFR